MARVLSPSRGRTSIPPRPRCPSRCSPTAGTRWWSPLRAGGRRRATRACSRARGSGSGRASCAPTRWAARPSSASPPPRPSPRPSPGRTHPAPRSTRWCSPDPETGRSPLHGRRTTSLLRSQELLAWRLTRRRLGTYYRTYPETTVQDEVTEALARPDDYVTGPTALFRDRLGRPGFSVVDGRYVSARWPGDAHGFALAIDRLL